MAAATLALLLLPGHITALAQAPAAQASSRTERTVWYFTASSGDSRTSSSACSNATTCRS